MPQVSPSSRSVHFGTFDLDLQSGELRKNGLKIGLPNQSFQILARLLERPGEVVSREELRQTLWSDDTFVDFEVGLSSAVKKLRDALGDSAENARFVETLPKRGYRFIGPVTRPQDTTVINTVVESPAQKRSLQAPWPRIAILVMIVAALAIVSFTAVRHRVVVDAKLPSIRSIAVLPLANLTGILDKSTSWME